MSSKIKILLVMLVLLLSGMACSQLYEFNCAAKGGVWVESTWEDNAYIPAFCDRSEPNTTKPDAEVQVDNNTANQDVDSPEPEASQHAPLEKADPAECNAASSLRVTVKEPEIKDTDYETLCKYTVIFTNTGDERIWVFVHKREKGADTVIEETWKNYYSLDPKESLEMGYRTLLYKDAGTTWIKTVTDVAPIYTTETCKNTFRKDTAPRAQISYPIEVACADP